MKQLPSGQDNTLTANDRAPLYERIKEQQLKQEQAIFDQEQAQNKVYFRLRVAMSVVAIPVIPAEMAICALILLAPHQDAIVKRIAASILFSSTLLMCYLWKVLVNRTSVARPKPITMTEEASPEPADQETADQRMDHSSKPGSQAKDPDSRGLSR